MLKCAKNSLKLENLFGIKNKKFTKIIWILLKNIENREETVARSLQKLIKEDLKILCKSLAEISSLVFFNFFKIGPIFF